MLAPLATLPQCLCQLPGRLQYVQSPSRACSPLASQCPAALSTRARGLLCSSHARASTAAVLTGCAFTGSRRGAACRGTSSTLQAVVPGPVDKPQALPSLERVALVPERLAREHPVQLGEQLRHSLLRRVCRARPWRAGGLRHVFAPLLCGAGRPDAGKASSATRSARGVGGRVS